MRGSGAAPQPHDLGGGEALHQPRYVHQWGPSLDANSRVCGPFGRLHVESFPSLHLREGLVAWAACFSFWQLAAVHHQR